MPDFNELKSKVQGLLGDHGDKAEAAIDKGADMAGDRFGEHADKIDQGAEHLKGMIPEQAAGASGAMPGQVAGQVPTEVPTEVPGQAEHLPEQGEPA